MNDLHLLSKLKMNSASEGPKSQMDDWSEVPQLAKDRSSWSISADGCLKDIAKLQGKLPTHTFSAMESQLLVVHASSLCTHSQYLTQLIRSFSQEGSEGKGISVLLCDLLYKCIHHVSSYKYNTWFHYQAHDSENSFSNCPMNIPC